MHKNSRMDTLSTMSELTMGSEFDDLSAAPSMMELDSMDSSGNIRETSSNLLDKKATSPPKSFLRRCCCSVFCCVPFCVLFFLPLLGFGLFCLIWPLTIGEIDAVWDEYLESPPPDVVDLRTELMERAIAVADSIPNPPSLDIDVVVAGGYVASAPK